MWIFEVPLTKEQSGNFIPFVLEIPKILVFLR